MSKTEVKSSSHPRGQESIRYYRLTHIAFNPEDYFQITAECFDQCYNNSDLKHCARTCIQKKSQFREYACSRDTLNILFKYA